MHRNELFYIALLVFLRFGLSSCTPAEGQQPESRARRVQNLYLARIAELDSAVRALEASGKQFVARKVPLEDLHTRFVECRRRYKRCETFAEYFSPAAAREINGAARDEVEENDPNQLIRRAEGLQVIEGLLFPSFDPADGEDLLSLMRNLKSAVVKLKTLALSAEFTDGQIFEAAKLELVRIIALGITGFDAMIVQSSIQEAREALAATAEALSIYRGTAPEEYGALQGAFDSAISYLHDNSDFAQFDRVDFIRNYINRISRQLVAYQRAVGVKEIPSRRALNPNALTVFEQGAFNAAYYAPSTAQVSDDQIALGKSLFFDPVLSTNNRRACASCHDPARGFADGQAKSLALDFVGTVDRNSPTLLNAGLQRTYFYDSRVTYLEDQIVAVMTNHKEFGSTPTEIVDKLSESDEYRALFAKAFPNEAKPVTVANLKSALANFVRSLVSMDSPFDRYMRGESKSIPENVRRGFNLFAGKAKCATCHFVPLFNGTVPPYFDKSEFEILGTLQKPDTIKGVMDRDLGRANVDRIGLNRHGFKTPTVRNVALTAPYMHNGAYPTLEDVLHFYNHGGGAGVGLDVPNQTLPPEKLQLSQSEMKDILAFLQALTDTTLRVDKPSSLPKFSSHRLAARQVGGEY